MSEDSYMEACEEEIEESTLDELDLEEEISGDEDDN
jgi:hypothetical protein